jgi:GntR family transcriptional regulator/MocR family aminotransferase
MAIMRLGGAGPKEPPCVAEVRPVARQTRLDSRFAHIKIDAASSVPKHRQIYAALRQAILEGRLQAYDALPSTRQLAVELGVSRNTIMVAYELLLAEGYVVGRGGAGTFVARGAVRPQRKPPTVPVEPRPLSQAAEILRVWRLPELASLARPFRPSSPAFDAFPVAKWSRIVARLLRDESARWVVSEGDPQGYLPLRKAIAAHLFTVRTCDCSPDQIVIVSGSQLALFMSALLLMNHDDAVWIEEPGYPHARLTFRVRSSRVIPVPTSEAGIDIDVGKSLSADPSVIYVTPTHQWPLGFTMPVQKRLALLDFAAKTGAWIVEDDYDGDLRYDRKTYATLFGLGESHRVLHVGTFTKTMLPGLRIGFIVLPADLVDSFVAGRQILDRFPNTISQAALAEFMESGAYARHIYDMQTLYLERHQLLRERITKQLAGFLHARKAQTGTFTVTEVTGGVDDVALAAALKKEGFDSVPLSLAYAGPPAKHGLLLGHAVARPDEIRKGVNALERIASTMGSLRRSSP